MRDLKNCVLARKGDHPWHQIPKSRCFEYEGPGELSSRFLLRMDGKRIGDV